MTCWNQSVRYNYSCLTLATLIKMSTKPSPKSVVIESSVKSDILGWVWQRIQEPLTNRHTWLGLTEDSRITGKLACLAWFDRRFKKDRLIGIFGLVWQKIQEPLTNWYAWLGLTEGSRTTDKLACLAWFDRRFKNHWQIVMLGLVWQKIQERPTNWHIWLGLTKDSRTTD